MRIKIISQILLFCTFSLFADRGYITNYNEKYMWSGTGEVFVPNFVMLGENTVTDLTKITESSMDAFLNDMFDKNGFNGVHIKPDGQWFHIGEEVVTSSDKNPDTRTFDKIEMIIKKVYARGGCCHIWMWGDNSRNENCNSTSGGLMGPEEKAVHDMVASRLGPLKGWTVGYGFDLWEWVNKSQLKSWYDYMKAKPGFNHLLGARGEKNSVSQIYDGLDYSGYEDHKPDYNKYVELLSHLPGKPSFSEDRFRVRGRSKDYTLEETRRGLWDATMAGGVAGIWGYLGSESAPSGSFPNADELLTYSKFWKTRFLKDMERDNSLSDGYCLKQGSTHYVYYKESTSLLQYEFVGASKQVIAVDAKKPYVQMDLGTKTPGQYTFNAPYASDWALAVGNFGVDPVEIREVKFGSVSPYLNIVPNPFNGITNISIPGVKTNTRFFFYNASGRIVDRLSTRQKSKIKWDGSAFPSGLYILEAQIGNKRFTKKLLLKK